MTTKATPRPLEKARVTVFETYKQGDERVTPVVLEVAEISFTTSLFADSRKRGIDLANSIAGAVNSYEAMREALEKAQAHIQMLEEKLGKRAPLDLQPTTTKTAIKAALALGERRQRMTTTHHTPGPWRVTHYETDETLINAGMDTVATIWRSEPAYEANARLIAASPELLKACKEMAALYDDDTTGFADFVGKFGNFTLVLEAIRKAEGA